MKNGPAYSHEEKIAIIREHGDVRSGPERDPTQSGKTSPRQPGIKNLSILRTNCVRLLWRAVQEKDYPFWPNLDLQNLQHAGESGMPFQSDSGAQS